MKIINFKLLIFFLIITNQTLSSSRQASSSSLSQEEELNLAFKHIRELTALSNEHLASIKGLKEQIAILLENKKHQDAKIAELGERLDEGIKVTLAQDHLYAINRRIELAELTLAILERRTEALKVLSLVKAHDKITFINQDIRALNTKFDEMRKTLLEKFNTIERRLQNCEKRLSNNESLEALINKMNSEIKRIQDLLSTNRRALSDGAARLANFIRPQSP